MGRLDGRAAEPSEEEIRFVWGENFLLFISGPWPIRGIIKTSKKKELKYRMPPKKRPHFNK